MDALKPIKLDAKYVKLVNDYLSGTDLPSLAEAHCIPVEEVSNFLNRKEVRSYIATVLQNYGYLNPVTRINLLNRMIEQKIEIAEETDTPLTKKDMVELIKLLQTEQQMIQKTSQPEEPVVNVNYLKLVQELSGEE
jgi:hypothetical protein